LHLFKQV